MGSQSRRKSTTVLLVDEDAMFRQGVRELLEEDGCQIAGEARSVEEAVARAVELTPDVVAMATKIRGSSGIEGTRRIREAVAGTRVLILTSSADPADADEAIRAGACGYLLKDSPPEEIVAAIRAAAAGESPLSPRIAANLLRTIRAELPAEAAPELTSRERSVLKLLAAGRSNTEIAEELSISVYTVKGHVSHLLVKLGVKNRTQAAVEAVRRGVL